MTQSFLLFLSLLVTATVSFGGTSTAVESFEPNHNSVCELRQQNQLLPNDHDDTEVTREAAELATQASFSQINNTRVCAPKSQELAFNLIRAPPTSV